MKKEEFKEIKTKDMVIGNYYYDKIDGFKMKLKSKEPDPVLDGILIFQCDASTPYELNENGDIEFSDYDDDIWWEKELTENEEK